MLKQERVKYHWTIQMNVERHKPLIPNCFSIFFVIEGTHGGRLSFFLLQKFSFKTFNGHFTANEIIKSHKRNCCNKVRDRILVERNSSPFQIGRGKRRSSILYILHLQFILLLPFQTSPHSRKGKNWMNI